VSNAKISHQQFFCLLALFHLSASLIFLPAPMAAAAGPDAWLAVPVGMFLGATPATILLGVLARRHPGLQFGALAERCLGKWLGRTVSLLLGGFSLFLTSLIIRDIMDFCAISLLQGTPMLVTAALFTATIWYAAYAGSEVITRMAVVTFLLVLLTILFMMLGLWDEMTWSRIQPLLAQGAAPVLKAAWPTVGWFAEFLAIAPFVFQISRPRKALAASALGNIAAALLLTIFVAVAVLVFSAPLTQKFIFPTFSLARQVSIGQFLERLEIGLLTVWLSAMVVKGAATLWTAAACLQWAMGVPRTRWVLPAIAPVAIWLTTIWPSEMALISFSTKIWTPMMLPFELGLPALLLAGSFWRSRRQRKEVPA